MKETRMNQDREKTAPSHFIRTIIREDIKNGKNEDRVHTRFPPEPNGYLHIGHAKSICLNFGMAEEFGGKCNLRFDDTNPEKEEVEYVDSIREDVRWLGFDWEDREYYASDYFGQLYEFAIELIRTGKAYVDHLTPEQIREYRGTLTRAGKESPYRNRTVDENLDLFEKMRNGAFAEGECVLRAKIDMASPNMNMRDPALYRIKKAHHHRTGDQWVIYPMYDFAHALSDAIEHITHSLCTLEFEDHRPLYDWCIENVSAPARPVQIEFARLNLSYTVLSKRKLLKLVKEGYVDGWDDPRMPTLSGLRRRGYTPEAIRDFSERIGVSKKDSTVDLSLLEYCLRDDLNKRAQRAMVVMQPLKVVIENYDEAAGGDELDAVNNPEDETMGVRKVPFGREIYIERDDFMENPPKKFFRLSPGSEVRLRYAYFITCREVIRNDTGEIVELRCTYDPASRGGNSPDGRKVRGTIHWVSAANAVDVDVRLYDNLFMKEDPDDVEQGKSFIDSINPSSLTIVKAKAEPMLGAVSPGERFQFERQGYFIADSRDHASGRPVFNRSVTLRDTWARIQAR
jgi:glutaminyl-tRNA synthetase